MSDLQTIGLILAAVVAGGALMVYLSEILNKRAFAILTGLADGVPVSLAQRRLMRHRMYFQYLGGLIAISIVLALALIRVAENVSDPNIKTLAYITAVIAGFPAFNWSILGTWTAIDCVKALRKEE